eukprot:6104110-Pleurochrysis_carterae.AAC.6
MNPITICSIAMAYAAHECDVRLLPARSALTCATRSVRCKITFDLADSVLAGLRLRAQHTHGIRRFGEAGKRKPEQRTYHTDCMILSCGRAAP